ncbi:MAG: hypothetical protein ABIR31_05655 [Ginsengibacter sp.]
MKILLLSLCIILLFPRVINIPGQPIPTYNHKEEFDSSLKSIKTLQKLSEAADHINQGKYSNKSFEYALIVSKILRERFYHGFSQYRFSENFIAVSTDYLLNNNISCLVDPEEIMKYPYAGCSQLVIVFAEIMKKNHVSYRSISFPHHLAIEFYLTDSWYFFDPNLEPQLTKEQRDVRHWHHSNDSLKKHYSSADHDLDFVFGVGQTAGIGKVNSPLASNARPFQSISIYISQWIWTIPLCFLIPLYIKKDTIT